ncbi:MAG: shikimate kinase [Firmicutes bacterium HGW-Firmicutes-14]|nr:MAG: shikimate kinase [Firmicutes bacterium HGW-Firmicutes-14]
MPNLVLTGFMGTGKTTVGKKLSGKLGMKLVDTDREIERVTGMTVNQIFKKHGEIRFRSEEKAAVKRIAKEDNQVISTGGGVVLDPENTTMLKENGIIICLTASPEVIYERVRRKKNRPLLQTEDPLGTINRLLNERAPFYRCADAVVDTSNRELDEVVGEVIRLFMEHK